MATRCVPWMLLVLAGTVHLCCASLGDTDPQFRKYVEQCAASGCLNGDCISGCVPEADAVEQWNASAARVAAPPELVLTQWDCLSECKFRSMELREQEKEGDPEKYFGKWPFTRVYGIQEPGSVAFSALNLLATVSGLTGFIHLVYFQLPRKLMGNKGPVYEYTLLVVIYGLAQCNSWLWSTVFHSRDTKLTEALDYSSAIAVVGFGILLAIIRTASIRVEASRVMVAAPVLAFFGAHIGYMNFYRFDYGWNILVCSVVGVTQLLLWMIWAALVRHPSALLVWASSILTGLALLLELYDFPPYWGLLDAHALWHAATIPITLMWWAFLRQDATYQTKMALSKSGKSVKKTD